MSKNLGDTKPGAPELSPDSCSAGSWRKSCGAVRAKSAELAANSCRALRAKSAEATSQKLGAANARSHGAGGLTLAADSPGRGQFSHLSKVISLKVISSYQKLFARRFRTYQYLALEKECIKKKILFLRPLIIPKYSSAYELYKTQY